MEFACKVTQSFELEGFIALIADRCCKLPMFGRDFVLLRKPDGSELEVDVRPVTISHGLDSPLDSPTHIHIEKLDRNNNSIKTSDIPLGCEVWYCQD